MGNIGTKIYGYCEGYFGRDDYKDKIIIFEGPKWIVCAYLDKDEITCLNFDSAEEKEECIKKWSKKEEEEDW